MTKFQDTFYNDNNSKGQSNKNDANYKNSLNKTQQIKNFTHIPEEELEQIWKSLLVSKETAEKMLSDISTYYEIFLNYCGYGEKINYNKLSYSGFVKFLRDCDLVCDPQVEHGKDRIASIVKAKESEMKKSTMNKSKKGMSMSNKLYSTLGTAVKTGSGKGGRILEAELNVLFQNLTGIKNFDIPNERPLTHSGKIFNKAYDTNGKTVILGRSSCLQSPPKNMINYSRMDFKLFVKSFESIAKKLYSTKSLDRAVVALIDNVINLFYKIILYFNIHRILLNSYVITIIVSLIRDMLLVT